MTEMTKQQAHLMVAAVRVAAHLHERSPKPSEIAGLLKVSESTVRLELITLQDLGIVVLVTSAYDDHVEIRDYSKLEELPDEVADSMTEDLADFDRRKQEEAEMMANLFAEKDHEKKHSERIDKMDQELSDFKNRKPINPFGDDE